MFQMLGILLIVLGAGGVLLLGAAELLLPRLIATGRFRPSGTATASSRDEPIRAEATAVADRGIDQGLTATTNDDRPLVADLFAKLFHLRSRISEMTVEVRTISGAEGPARSPSRGRHRAA